MISEPARSWAFRWSVEISAARAFLRLAAEFETLGYPDGFASACRDAAADETRHAALCEELARAHGADGPAPLDEPLTFAPGGMSRDHALVYDVVARCCIAETESMATLVTLSPLSQGRAKEVVREISKDEITHARLGWELLRHLHDQGADVRFLGPHVAGMLAANGDPTFVTADDAGAVAHGVLSAELKRQVFTECVTDVVLPGLELYGIDTSGARTWLSSKQRTPQGTALPA
jgi:hypothetical protein